MEAFLVVGSCGGKTSSSCNSGWWQHVRVDWRGYHARHCLEHLLYLLSGPWIDHSVACAPWRWSVSWKLKVTEHMLSSIFDVLSFVSPCTVCSDLRFVKSCIIVTVYWQFRSCISEENLCRVCGWARLVQRLPLQLCTNYEEPLYHGYVSSQVHSSMPAYVNLVR
jgi:hypothetical protein